MKSSLLFAAIVLAALAYFQFTNEDNKPINQQSDEYGYKVSQISETNKADTISSEVERQNESSMTSSPAAKESINSVKKEIRENTTEKDVIEMRVVLKDKSLDYSSIRDVLALEDFEQYLNNISDAATIEELEKQYELDSILNASKELISNEYSTACGNAICAVQIKDLPNNKSTSIQNDLLANLPLGASFISVKRNEAGTKDIRAVFQIEKTNSVRIHNVLNTK